MTHEAVLSCAAVVYIRPYAAYVTPSRSLGGIGKPSCIYVYIYALMITWWHSALSTPVSTPSVTARPRLCLVPRVCLETGSYPLPLFFSHVVALVARQVSAHCPSCIPYRNHKVLYLYNEV